MAEIDLSTTRQRWVGWFVFATIFIGGITIFMVLSALNAEEMALVAEDGQLYVEEGRFLPFGTQVSEEIEAFAPVDIPEGIDEESLPTGPCASREECEQRFYRSLVAIITALLESPEEARLQEARHLIVRAQLFPSITLAQRAPLEDLTGGIHYVEALVLLQGVRSELGAVQKKLERSRIAGVGFVDDTELQKLIEMVNKQIVMLEVRGIRELEPERPIPDVAAKTSEAEPPQTGDAGSSDDVDPSEDTEPPKDNSDDPEEAKTLELEPL